MPKAHQSPEGLHLMPGCFQQPPGGILISVSTVQPGKKPSKRLLRLCVRSFKGPTCHRAMSHFLSWTYKALPPWSLANLPKLTSHHEPPGILRLFPPSLLSGQLLLILRCQRHCSFPPELWLPKLGQGPLFCASTAPLVTPGQLSQTV